MQVVQGHQLWFWHPVEAPGVATSVFPGALGPPQMQGATSSSVMPACSCRFSLAPRPSKPTSSAPTLLKGRFLHEAVLAPHTPPPGDPTPRRLHISQPVTTA